MRRGLTGALLPLAVIVALGWSASAAPDGAPVASSAGGTVEFREVHVLLDGPGPDVQPLGSLPFVTLSNRWAYPVVEWSYNAANSPLADVAFATEGAAQWLDAGGTGFHFVYLGTTGLAPSCSVDQSEWKPDGHNTVGWGVLPAKVLGVTCLGGRRRLADGQVLIEEADIIFGSTSGITAGLAPLVATHEFGHMLGLDHTEAGKCPGPLMCAELTPGTSRTPTTDDLAGVASIYALFKNRLRAGLVGRE